MKNIQIVCFVSLLTVFSSSVYANLNGSKIGVDPGHGWNPTTKEGDSGTWDPTTGVRESIVNLPTSIALRDFLTQDGAEVVMSREGDYPAGNVTQRANFFNSQGVHFVISVHHDSVASTQTTLAYVNGGDCDMRSGGLANAIVQRLLQTTQQQVALGAAADASPKLCSGKPGVFESTNNFYGILRDTSMPATIIEVTRINNPNLSDPEYVKRNGWSIYAGLADFLGQTPLPINSNISHFDGAGSLIAPSSCMNAGCNRDVAMMHHHSTPSTVVFQWFNDSNYCDHIDIRTEPDIGEVIVQSRLWEEHFNGMAYRGRLPLSVPKAQGSKPSRWNITAITSTVPITNEWIKVFAECKQSSLTNSYYSSTKLDPTELVGFDFGYYWTGNGSLMSFAGTGTGKTEDLAITFNSHKSLTVFQWYASDSCSRVSISDKMGNAVALDGVQNEVAIKLWYVDDWDGTSCTSLPCPITAPQGENYYLVKIKTDADAVRSGQLKMICF